MKALGLLALLAAAPVAAGSEAPNPLAEKPLSLRDPAKELRDAEQEVVHGGGADAYAARADAKRSLGRPFEDFAADYAEAARLDPKKYGEKFSGVLEQHASEARHKVKKYRRSAGENNSNILARILLACALAVLVLISGLVMIRGRAGAP